MPNNTSSIQAGLDKYPQQMVESLIEDYIATLNNSQLYQINNYLYSAFDQTTRQQLMAQNPVIFPLTWQRLTEEINIGLQQMAAELEKFEQYYREQLNAKMLETENAHQELLDAYNKLLNFFNELTEYYVLQQKNALSTLLQQVQEALRALQAEIERLNLLINYFDVCIEKLNVKIANEKSELASALRESANSAKTHDPIPVKSIGGALAANGHKGPIPEVDVNELAKDTANEMAIVALKPGNRSLDEIYNISFNTCVTRQTQKILSVVPVHQQQKIMADLSSSALYQTEIIILSNAVNKIINYSNNAQIQRNMNNINTFFNQQNNLRMQKMEAEKIRARYINVVNIISGNEVVLSSSLSAKKSHGNSSLGKSSSYEVNYGPKPGNRSHGDDNDDESYKPASRKLK